MFKRGILSEIELFLKTNDILLFYGARQVGKTSLMKMVQNDFIKTKSYFFDLEKDENLQLLNKDPDIFVEYIKLYYNWD